MSPPEQGSPGAQTPAQAEAAATPHWAERLVRWLDDGWRLPGTQFRIGLDGILGLMFPAAGDALTTTAGLSLFVLALRRRVPKVVLLRMAVNIALDALIGAIPVLGDLFDFAFRSHRRNLRLIEAASTKERTRTRRKLGDYLVVGLALCLVVAACALPLVLAATFLLSAIG